MGVSPVDLEVEADLRSGVFQPLDRKPQTNRQLGKTQKREREIMFKKKKHVTVEKRTEMRRIWT